MKCNGVNLSRHVSGVARGVASHWSPTRSVNFSWYSWLDFLHQISATQHFYAAFSETALAAHSDTAPVICYESLNVFATLWDHCETIASSKLQTWWHLLPFIYGYLSRREEDNYGMTLHEQHGYFWKDRRSIWLHGGFLLVWPHSKFVTHYNSLCLPHPDSGFCILISPYPHSYVSLS